MHGSLRLHPATVRLTRLEEYVIQLFRRVRGL